MAISTDPGTIAGYFETLADDLMNASEALRAVALDDDETTPEYRFKVLERVEDKLVTEDFFKNLVEQIYHLGGAREEARRVLYPAKKTPKPKRTKKKGTKP